MSAVSLPVRSTGKATVSKSLLCQVENADQTEVFFDYEASLPTKYYRHSLSLYATFWWMVEIWPCSYDILEVKRKKKHGEMEGTTHAHVLIPSSCPFSSYFSFCALLAVWWMPTFCFMHQSVAYRRSLSSSCYKTTLCTFKWEEQIFCESGANVYPAVKTEGHLLVE